MIDSSINCVLTVIAAWCKVLLFTICCDLKLTLMDVELLDHHRSWYACITGLILSERLLLDSVAVSSLDHVKAVA